MRMKYSPHGGVVFTPEIDIPSKWACPQLKDVNVNPLERPRGLEVS